jgi:hypothetical protein
MKQIVNSIAGFVFLGAGSAFAGLIIKVVADLIFGCDLSPMATVVVVYILLSIWGAAQYAGDGKIAKLWYIAGVQIGIGYVLYWGFGGRFSELVQQKAWMSAFCYTVFLAALSLFVHCRTSEKSRY